MLAARSRQAIWRSGSFPGGPVEQWAVDESSNTKYEIRLKNIPNVFALLPNWFLTDVRSAAVELTSQELFIPFIFLCSDHFSLVHTSSVAFKPSCYKTKSIFSRFQRLNMLND